MRRARARSGLLRLIAVTIAFIAAALSIVVGHAQLASTEALREVAKTTFAEDSFFRVHTTTSNDPSGQLDAASAQFQELSLHEGLSITSVSYIDPRPLYYAEALPAIPGVSLFGWTPSADPLVVDGTLDRFTSSNTGVAPPDISGPIPAVISAGATDAFNLSVGETLAVDGAAGTVMVEIVAVVTPDHADAAFFLPVPSQDSDTDPPLVVAVPQAHFDAFSDPTKVQWVFTIDPKRVAASDLPVLARGLAVLPQLLINDRAVSNGGLIPSGGLDFVLVTATEATQSVKAVIPVALVLLGVLSIVTIVQVSRLLDGSRAVEAHLMAARGASTAQRTVLAVAETVVLAAAASAAGWFIAVAVIPFFGSWPDSVTGWFGIASEFAGATWLTPVMCTATTITAFVTPTWFSGRSGSMLASASQARHGGKVASFGLLAAVILLAGLSVWQFLLYGSPLSQSADGQIDVNPLAAPAPALLLLALTTAILVLVAGIARIVERMSTAKSGLSLFFASAQVSRRIATLLIPIALISLTVGATTFTAVYAETAALSQRTAAQLANGSAVRLVFSGPSSIGSPSDITDLDRFSALTEVSDASRVYRGAAKLGSEDVPLIALDSTKLGALMGEDSGALDVEALGAALAPSAEPERSTFDLSPETTSLRLELLSSPVTENQATPPDTSRLASVRIWILDDSGLFVPVDAGSFTVTATDGQAHTLIAELPPGLTPIKIAAVDVSVSADAAPQGHTIEIVSITGDMGGDSGNRWGFTPNSMIGIAPDAMPSGQVRPSDLSPGVGVIFAPDPLQGPRTGARLMPDPRSQPRIPVAATVALLETLDLKVGDEVVLRQGGVELDGLIRAEVPVVPGTTESAAILVDLRAYGQAMLSSSSVQPRPAELWLGAEDAPAAEMATNAMVRGSGVSLTTSSAAISARFLAPGTTVLWLGTTGSLAIGGVAILVCVVTLVRSREPEVAVLRALGLSARRQARGRRGEFQTVSAAAMVLGVTAGAAASVLLAAPLAEAVLVGAPDTLRAPLKLAGYQFVALLTGQCILVGIAAWYYGTRVHQQAANKPVPGRDVE